METVEKKFVKVEFEPEKRKAIFRLSIELVEARNRLSALERIGTDFESVEDAITYAEAMAKADNNVKRIERNVMIYALKASTLPLRMAQEISYIAILTIPAFPWINVTAQVTPMSADEEEEPEEDAKSDCIQQEEPIPPDTSHIIRPKVTEGA